MVLTSGLWGQNALMSAALDVAAVATGGIESRLGGLYASAWSVPLATMLTAFALVRSVFAPVPQSSTGDRNDTPESIESPPASGMPAWLAALAAIVLAPAVAGPTPWLQRYLTGVWTGGANTSESTLFTFGNGIGLVVMIVGISAAWLWRPQVGQPQRRESSLASLARNRFYMTEVLSTALVLPVRVAARVCLVVDRLIDGLLFGLPNRVSAAVDRGTGPLRNGLVQFYGLSIVLAAGVLVVTVLWLTG
jgi:hypothetical protein